jgi:hypothetical protein
MYALGNMLVQGCTTTQEFQVCLQCIILSVGHFPYYGSPDLTLIKASLDWFSLGVFPGVYTQKYWCLYVLDLVSLFMFPLHV